MDNSAFNRGRRAAGFWIRLSKSAKAVNDICISWAKRRGLPVFMGRLRGLRAIDVKNHAKSFQIADISPYTHFL